MKYKKMVNKILEFTKPQGGHIGFKEISFGENKKILDISVRSDGYINYTRFDWK